ncbi:hypothetical protein DHEL01_v202222 [Diaporthe helianthi]|uniref:Uncharacterized protein n=1 Tax=Diaporthe helianthi TaxID=158607 RepID=A0A2P5IA56_DIAHE|nr:hypothetical protein DHEL01_v202222 [Diaporthe helianthi]
MDSDHDGSLDGVWDGGQDGGQDGGASLASSPDEFNNFDEAEMFWLGRSTQTQAVPAPNGGLSAENLAQLSNAQAGSSQSHGLLHLSSIGSEGMPSQEDEQMNIRLRGQRRRSSVVSESGLDRKSELKDTGPRSQRRRSF